MMREMMREETGRARLERRACAFFPRALLFYACALLLCPPLTSTANSSLIRRHSSARPAWAAARCEAGGGGGDGARLLPARLLLPFPAGALTGRRESAIGLTSRKRLRAFCTSASQAGVGEEPFSPLSAREEEREREREKEGVPAICDALPAWRESSFFFFHTRRPRTLKPPHTARAHAWLHARNPKRAACPLTHSAPRGETQQRPPLPPPPTPPPLSLERKKARARPSLFTPSLLTVPPPARPSPPWRPG